jgi:hypothetical protein
MPLCIDFDDFQMDAIARWQIGDCKQRSDEVA